MNSQELAKAMKQRMKQGPILDRIADLAQEGIAWSWGVGVFNEISAKEAKLPTKECLNIWPVDNSEIALTTLEQLTMLDTSEVDYHFIENNLGPYFIGLWVEQVPAHSIV